MSETQEREVELVAGTIGGITQKKADTWTVAIAVDGLQNPKNLWTKDADLIESLQGKFGQAGAFVCGASYWQHPQHGQVRSLWIDSVANGTENVPERVATPEAAVKFEGAVNTKTGQPIPRVYAPDLKDRMIVRQTALKAAAEIVGPRAGSTMDPDYDAALETMRAAQRFETWVYRDIDAPPSNAPELSAHDDGIPF